MVPSLGPEPIGEQHLVLRTKEAIVFLIKIQGNALFLDRALPIYGHAIVSPFPWDLNGIVRVSRGE